MIEKFRIVKLSKVLTHQKKFHVIDDTETYKRCRVRLHAKGIVLRDEIEGYRIKTKKQQFCQTGEFLVAEIDAKVGGFGIVPPELDRAIVSSHYFLFTIDEEQLDRRFLNCYIRTLDFREQVNARGSTNYAAIRPRHVLDMTIPLPPLPEQRRIVVKIEKLTAKIEEAKKLRAESLSDAASIIRSMLWQIFQRLKAINTKQVEIDDIADVYRGKGPFYSPDSDTIAINQKCIRWEGIDLVHAKTVDPLWVKSLSYKSKFKSGDIAVNSTGEGTIGRACIVGDEYDGLPFDSHVLAVRVRPNILYPDFLAWFIMSPIGQSQIEDSKSAKTTKQTELGVNKMRNMVLPLPSLREQRKIAEYLQDLQIQVNELKGLQVTTQKKLEGLIPSILAKAFRGKL